MACDKSYGEARPNILWLFAALLHCNSLSASRPERRCLVQCVAGCSAGNTTHVEAILEDQSTMVLLKQAGHMGGYKPCDVGC